MDDPIAQIIAMIGGVLTRIFVFLPCSIPFFLIILGASTFFTGIAKNIAIIQELGGFTFFLGVIWYSFHIRNDR